MEMDRPVILREWTKRILFQSSQKGPEYSKDGSAPSSGRVRQKRSSMEQAGEHDGNKPLWTGKLNAGNLIAL
jgi:hypothetical protein